MSESQTPPSESNEVFSYEDAEWIANNCTPIGRPIPDPEAYLRNHQAALKVLRRSRERFVSVIETGNGLGFKSVTEITEQTVAKVDEIIGKLERTL